MPRKPVNIPPVQQMGSIYKIFKQYGDTTTARKLATDTLTSILTFYYGSTYEYRYYGTSVDSATGYITKSFVDWYNYLVHDTPSLNVGQAMQQIQDSGSVNISFIARPNPYYEGSTGYSYEKRLPPYSTKDKFLNYSKGIQNSRYHGCKLTSPGININSNDTSDKGPVVKIVKVNQSQIIFSNNNVTTATANTSGLPVRQLSGNG